MFGIAGIVDFSGMAFDQDAVARMTRARFDGRSPRNGPVAGCRVFRSITLLSQRGS